MPMMLTIILMMKNRWPRWSTDLAASFSESQKSKLDAASATHPCLFPCIQYRNRWKNWTDLLSDTAQLKLTPLYPRHLPIHKICYHAVPNYNMRHICFFANLVIYEVNSNCWRVFINILVPLKLDTKARCLMPRWITIFQLQKGACPLFFPLSYTRCPKKRF